MKVKLLVCVCVIALSISVSAQQNDTVWKATLTYCVNKEEPDLYMLEERVQKERCDVYNFSLKNHYGSLYDVIRLLKDSISKGIHETSGINLWAKMQFDEPWYDYISLVSDEINDISSYGEKGFKKGNAVIFDTNDFYKHDIGGIMMNRIWSYDIKTHYLSSTYTDVSLLEFPPQVNFPLGYGAYKFCSHPNIESGFNQDAFRPEIVWCRNMSLPIVTNSKKENKLFVYKRRKPGDDTTLYKRYYLVGEPRESISPAYCDVTTPVKTTFDRTLPDWILGESIAGNLDVYENTEGNNIGKKLTHEEALKLAIRYDTVVEENGWYQVIKIEVQKEQLYGFKIKEEISFNKKTFRFESKITYAAICYSPLNRNTGKVDVNQAPEILYWVKFND